jgi:GntR family transcriptional regulator of arabinose operon
MKKYQKIEQWIKEGIGSGRFLPGDKLPSESQLCEQFGISRNSIRQAINNLIHAGWLESKKGIGTFCLLRNRNLTTNIGFVCYYTRSYIFPRIIHGCDRVLYRSGFHLLLNQSEYDLEKERNILQSLKKKGVDGIIIEPIYSGSEPSNRELLLELQSQGIPIILIDNYFPGADFSFIALDDRRGGQIAASHLWEKGHRRIGILYKENYFPSILRKEGARSFLQERGAEPRADWIIGFRGQEPTGAAYRAGKAFFARAEELPSAFVCCNDEESLQWIQAAEERSIRVPEQLSIISFDNSDLAKLEKISLTSIDHPGSYMGEAAMNLLLARIYHPEIRNRTTSLIEPVIVERASVVNIRPLEPKK